jgi:hypothetical protein
MGVIGLFDLQEDFVVALAHNVPDISSHERHIDYWQ